MGSIVSVYHLHVHLDEYFVSLTEAETFLRSPTCLIPSIPKSRIFTENSETRRISVCDSITECVTALDVEGPFHRCLQANADVADEYAPDLTYPETEGNIEQYPIGIIKIEVDEDYLHTPSSKEVPDADLTGEKWLLDMSGIKSVESKLVWIDNNSVLVNFNDLIGDVDFSIYACDHLSYSDTPYSDCHHPWLDGKGHLLNSRKGDWEEPDTKNGFGMKIIPITKSKGEFQVNDM